MKKRITKRNWYDDELEDGKAKAPSVAPDDERHLDGINRGEIKINDNADDPTIFIRDNKGKVIGFKPSANVDIEELKKLFLGKYGPDRTEHLLEMLGGIFVRGGIDTDSIKSELVDAIKVLATDVDAAETVSGKNVLAADTVKGNYIEATEAVKGKNAAISGKTTTLNLLVQQLAEMYDLNVSHVATLFRTIVKDYVSSETFIPGLMGEGMKLYKALNGDWNLEIDNLVVRKIMTVFELVISKIRAVNGGLVISPANGTVKSVSSTTGTPSYYVLTIEGDMMFVEHDLVRCQVFTSGQAKYYWVPVASVTADSILILKSEFTNGVTPASGDDLVQMGNRTNTARQGLLYLTAAEDGKPRICVLDSVNSTSTVGKSKVILGCLDGMTDTDFPADFQPSGYGLYAMNVFLKGVFVLRNGKTVEGELTSANAAAGAANAAATAAKQIADAAKSLADSANTLLSDIASDNKFTPSEKQSTKKEWDAIMSEKAKNDAAAMKYGVSGVAYNAAYTTLSAYIIPLLASLTTTSDIIGTTFRSTFKAYYDARTDLLNAISAKAKDLADAAQSKATEAANAANAAQSKANEASAAAGASQTTANDALKGANGANALLSDIANDNKLTAQEKQQTKKEWDVITSEKVKNDASADKYGISKAAYLAAYTTLSTYIAPLLVNLSVTSDIVGSTFRANFKGYYDARTDLLNAISAKSKDLADAAQGKADSAASAAATAQRDATAAGAAAGSAQTTANNAATAAATANTLLTDIASDNKLTATEKQQTKKEWDVIMSEKPLNNASAVKFSIATTTYDAAYNALNTYVAPLLANLTATSDIVGTTFRSTFKTYYDARTNLLNAISEKAKLLADTAQTKANQAASAASTAQTKANEAATAAGTAQSTANNALSNANGANALLADIASDNKLTATEKQQAKKEWDQIVSEKPLNNASAVKFSVATTAYDSAYSTLSTYITPLLASLTTTSDIVGTTFRSTFKAYYDGRTNLLNAVSAAAKKLADDAQKAADSAQSKADTVTRLFQEFTVAGGVFESKISEVKTYADGKVDGLQIGGRNLFLNSTLGWSADRFISISTYDILGSYVGKQATISFDIKASISRELEVYMYQGSGVSIALTGGTCMPLTDKYTRFNFTGNIVSANIPEGYTRGAIAIYDRAGSNTLYIKNIKVELGNKATDWTPAPEDVAADAQTKANAAQAAAEAVAIAKAALAKTEASAYADGIVSAEEQRAINDAKAKLEEAKRDAQAKADAAKNAAIGDAAGKYTTKTEHSSSITQLSGKIELKVAKTDFDALGRRVGTAETTITQHTNQISLKASQSDVTALGSRMSSAEAKITPDAIKLTVKSQTDSIAAAAARRTTVLVDATGLDTTKYYPITISLNPTDPYTITVQRSLDVGMGKPSWSTHAAGFSVLCRWTSNGSVWGTIPVQRTIHTYTFAHSTITPVGSIGQLTNSSLEYAYVRGGSKYYVVVDGSSSAAIVLRTSAYTQSDQTVGILTSVTVPVPDIDAVNTRITNVETSFEIREGQISSKVSQATTSATNAKTSETNAATSASTAGTKATAAANSASDAAAKLAAITTKETSINQTENS